MGFHFLTCLRNEVFGPITRNTKRSQVCASAILFGDVYCICCRPFFEYELEQHPKMFMANCSECNVSYHQKCITIPENNFENSRLNWLCPHC